LTSITNYYFFMTRTSPTKPRNFAVIGAGMAGIACARTLVQAGHTVTVFEKSAGAGGRMSTRDTPFGSFDHGVQYFTVRDERFRKAMQWALGNRPDIARPWSANAVRVLDALGRVVAAPLPVHEAHWVAQPGMNALVRDWAAPLEIEHLQSRVTRMQRTAKGDWQLQVTRADDSLRTHGGFDAVVLAIPSAQARELLQTSQQKLNWLSALDAVQVAPCWTLMIAFPQAMQPSLSSLGPQWNAARSTHHRIAWLARESSKPARDPMERWTVQASAAWSREHLEDDAERITAKLHKAFSEITGIRADPSYAESHRWRYAKTEKPLGESHLWDAEHGIGLCGDWCLGHRVEDAFLSGLELARAAL
jgi:renalase